MSDPSIQQNLVGLSAVHLTCREIQSLHAQVRTVPYDQIQNRVNHRQASYRVGKGKLRPRRLNLVFALPEVLVNVQLGRRSRNAYKHVLGRTAYQLINVAWNVRRYLSGQIDCIVSIIVVVHVVLVNACVRTLWIRKVDKVRHRQRYAKRF